MDKKDKNVEKEQEPELKSEKQEETDTLEKLEKSTDNTRCMLLLTIICISLAISVYFIGVHIFNSSHVNSNLDSMTNFEIMLKN